MGFFGLFGAKCAKCAGKFGDPAQCGVLEVESGSETIVMDRMTCGSCNKTTCPQCIAKENGCPVCGSTDMHGTKMK